MSTITTAPVRPLIASLCSDMCPACGGFKRGGKTLCSGCYWRLPVVVQEGLKVDFGCGYGSAVEKALSMLKAGDGYWPRKR